MMEEDLETLTSTPSNIGSLSCKVMASPVEVISVNEVLNQTYEVNSRPKRWSCKIRKMYLAAFCCLLWAVAMGFCTGYSAPATYHMKKSSLNPSDDNITWIGSVLALGAMVGGLLGGRLADKIGRRGCLLLNVLVFTAGWFSITMSFSVFPIIFGRFLCGIACGIVSVAVPMYCVEISTPEVRGLLGSLFQTFMVTGNLLCTIIGSYLTWEHLALSGAGVAGLALVCFVTMPESPKWWLARNERYKAHKVIRQLQGRHLDANKECDRIYNELQSQPSGSLKMKEILNPIIYKPALLTVGLMFFQQFSGSNAVLFYSTQIFSVNKNFMDPRVATIVLGAVQVVATVFSNLLVDKVGRKFLLLLSGAIMCISLLCLGLFYYETITRTQGGAMFLPWIPLLSVGVFMVAFSIGFGPIPWLLVSELVPLRARSTVGGLATFANGLFAFVVTKTFALLLDLIHNYGTFMSYGVISGISCIFVVVFIPETKGKETEEIASFFHKDRIRNTETVGEICAMSVDRRVRESQKGSNISSSYEDNMLSKNISEESENKVCNEQLKDKTLIDSCKELPKNKNNTLTLDVHELSKDECTEPTESPINKQSKDICNEQPDDLIKEQSKL